MFCGKRKYKLKQLPTETSESTEEIPQVYSKLEAITLSYNTVTVDKLFSTFEKHGVCVITDVFTPEFCEGAFEEVISFLENLQGGADRQDPDSFTDDNTFPQKVPGMHHIGLSNTKHHWKARTDEKLLKIFECLYFHDPDSKNSGKTALSQLDVSKDRLQVSGDGLSFLPDAVYDYRKDWPHIDQSHTNIGWKCNIQGQVVVTDTQHSFRCSPMSHRAFSAMKKRAQWITSMHYVPIGRMVDIAKEELAKVGGEFQVRIPAPRGSFIVWDARLIHSNYRQAYKPAGPRCVLYVSYRPKHKLPKRGKFARSISFFNNLTTNHWGDQISIPTIRPTTRSEIVKEIRSRPELVYSQLCSPPDLDPLVRSLTCIDDCIKMLPEFEEVVNLYNNKDYTTAADLSMEMYGRILRGSKNDEDELKPN